MSLAAYETLGDEKERKSFDHHGTAGGQGGQGFQGSQGFQGQWKPKNFKDIKLDDIFASFFQEPGAKKRGAQGQGQQQFQFSFGGGDGDEDGFESLFKTAFGGAGRWEQLEWGAC